MLLFLRLSGYVRFDELKAKHEKLPAEICVFSYDIAYLSSDLAFYSCHCQYLACHCPPSTASAPT